jgi:hypothetical protein
MLAVATPTLALAACSNANLRPLLDPVRRQRNRQFVRQSQRREVHRRPVHLAGCRPQIHRQLVALLLQLLLQRRQGRPHRRQRRLLRQHIRPTDPAQREPPLSHVELLLIQPDDLLRGVDLRLQGRLGQRRRHPVGGQ